MNKERPSGLPELFEGSKSGLELDAKNLFCGEYLGLGVAGKYGDFETLNPIKTYEEYVNKNFSPNEASDILKRSNQANVNKVNELVAEYNALLPQIKSEKNAKLGLDILKKINDIFIGEL